MASRSPHGPFLPLSTDHGGFPLPDEKNNQLQEGASVTESSLINSQRAEDIVVGPQPRNEDGADRLSCHRTVCGREDVDSPGTGQVIQSWVPACILVLNPQEPTPTQQPICPELRRRWRADPAGGRHQLGTVRASRGGSVTVLQPRTLALTGTATSGHAVLEGRARLPSVLTITSPLQSPGRATSLHPLPGSRSDSSFWVPVPHQGGTRGPVALGCPVVTVQGPWLPRASFLPL